MAMQETENIEWVDIGVDGLENFVPGLPKGDAILVRGEPGKKEKNAYTSLQKKPPKR
jgi:hypothetical protein